MKVCTKCGQELAAGASYCNACGHGLKKGSQQEVLLGKRSRVTAGEKRWVRTGLITATVLFSVLAAWVLFGSYGKKAELAFNRTATADTRGAETYARVKGEDGLVRIPASDLNGRSTRFYVYSAGDREVKFFLLRTQGGSIRAALDACQACYRAKLGYRQEGDTFICKNCGMAFRKDDIGIVTGGCNPIPVKRKLDGDLVVINAKELEEGAKYF